jgi:signal transduction histidine kinase
MRNEWLRRLRWLFGWVVLVVAGSLAIVRMDIAQRRDAFQTDARIAHRLLSQRAVQHDAILATLVLLSPAIDGRDQPEQRLSAVQPQVTAVLRRDPGQTWSDLALLSAHTRSQAAGRAELASVDVQAMQFTMVRAGEPSSFALVIDVRRMVPWDDWPIARAGPVSVMLVHAAQALVIQPGQAADEEPAGLTGGFVFTKRLATASQPFDLQLRYATGPAQWPWRWLSAWALLAALGVGVFKAWQQGRWARRRAEELLRVGQVSRLNAMGELAAGVAHELNQPLTAVMANTQAARRLIEDDPPELEAARQAMMQVAAQTRRAADVVARLRRLVEAPGSTPSTRAVQLEVVARQVLDLVEPEAHRRGVVAMMEGQAPPVQADPVALEQIVHNLVSNAMHSLESMPLAHRRLVLQVAVEQGQGVLTVRDSGPGISTEALPRLFEPFYTTRRGGLGLGLSLCETLAQAMQGTLSARNADPRGAEFRLALPLAVPSS